MLTQMINTERSYSKLFCQTSEDSTRIRFWDDEISDMYTHNYTLIKTKDERLMEYINEELVLRAEQGHSFLRIELNEELNELDKIKLSQFSNNPEITEYDYMFISTNSFSDIDGNNECIITKAISNEQMLDGMHVDIEANKEAMGVDFARRRIERKSLVYRASDHPLDLFVCYYNGVPIGNCELMIDGNIAKIEDFDILPEYQRRGFGSAVIKHILKHAKENGVAYAYLITDRSDTAKEMYSKCGLEKIGTKTELFFKLS